ncbi:peroxiredoxin-like family protein [Ferrimonas futtsuensis]|uniref:peroxiredoxin-like family protein n=1 Tax=Ferrimonas futtsuensis TaxID=364764 RepID=UPI000404E2E7|nr:peroxiredoxin-like family protein [Ferrimonas futtsuensis]
MNLWGLFAALLLSLPLHAAIAPAPTQVTPLLNGMTIPAPALTGLDGRSQPLSGWLKGKPSLLVFYRGGWCPYCNAQLSGLKKIEAQLASMGVQIVAISPDPAEQLRDGPGDTGYLLLSDRSLQASESFGLAYTLTPELSAAYRGKMGRRLVTEQGSDLVVLPVPAVYLVDADGLVHFSYLNPNYKVRVAPELILTAAKLMLKP